MANVAPSLEPLLQPGSPVQELARRLADAGHQCLLVGGSVRDGLLGRDHSDIDVTTDARPDVVEGLVRGWADAVWTQGARFGTVGAKRKGVTLEITTFRAEVYRPESRKPEVAYADDVETDLSRRDFTVNAMALRLPDGVLVDPYGGAVDLLNQRLRTPLSPEVSFLDDPLRMLRAARFIATFGLVPDDELVEAVEQHRGRLEIVSAERIRDELSKLLLVEDPTAGLWFLAETGLADEFLPELNLMRLEQDPVHHHKDVLAHTIAVVRNTRPELLVRLAALFHDVGKPKTRSFEKGAGGVSFHHHEVVGARHDRGAAARPQVPERDRGRRHPARVPPSAHPHLRDGLDRQGRAPVRARRRAPARRPQPPAALRLHHAQPEARGRAPAPDGRARGAHRGAARARGARFDQAAARRPPGDGVPRRGAEPRRGRGARIPARGPPRRRTHRRGRCLRRASQCGPRNAASTLQEPDGRELRRPLCGRARRWWWGAWRRGSRGGARRSCRPGSRRGRAR